MSRSDDDHDWEDIYEDESEEEEDDDDRSHDEDDGGVRILLGDDEDDGEYIQANQGMLAQLLRALGAGHENPFGLMGRPGRAEEFEDEEQEPSAPTISGALAAKRPKCAPKLQASELATSMVRSTGYSTPMARYGRNIHQAILTRKQNGLTRPGGSRGESVRISNQFLPCAKQARLQAQFHDHIFCGVHSGSGDYFMSACQDSTLRLYDTRGMDFRLERTLHARDVGWAVVDTSYSPDEHFLIYSSWSNYIHLITLDGDRHEALLLEEAGGRLCPFSIRFSSDSREVICGTNLASVMVYDCVRDERTINFEGHDDDINAVCFADASTNILISGSDDCLAKVWDRRIVNQAHPRPIGTMKGHQRGLTFLDSMGDGRYFLSQGKDNAIKLWDIRNMSSADTSAPNLPQNDYRWGFEDPGLSNRRLRGDTSIMTYKGGHSVHRTLIRARFSPAHCTGQRYIYSGSGDGVVAIYDILTGEVVQRLHVHSAIARDVSWHPTKQSLVSSSVRVAQYCVPCPGPNMISFNRLWRATGRVAQCSSTLCHL
eukprot:TRINITY_DN12002_c0_g2_i5.p1 TRINITY_DN12002_c0_g2~~TRINITY_DN12002_c0_g2_i5.p1  ORF type:complete len:542 (+),score=98.43 TRINITY_DN12002_c0_g2_i5:90-1715(+)